MWETFYYKVTHISKNLQPDTPPTKQPNTLRINLTVPLTTDQLLIEIILYQDASLNET